MRLGQSSPLTDAADLRFRAATVNAGSVLTVAIVAAGLFYAGKTWDAGNRVPIVAIMLSAVAIALIVLLVLPTDRIIAGRWRETFFMSWSIAMIVMVLLLGALDPLPKSPLTLPLFMPLLFAGMSYPVRTATIASAAVTGGFLALCVATREPLAYSSFVFFSLVWTAGMCLWQAQLRDHQRRELEHHRDQLALLSRADALTGALNRRGFDERLQAELSEAARAGRPLTLAVLDLDDFKSINDRQGHAAGDAVLVQLVELLGEALRPMDAIGRLGGDEFALVLPGTSAGDAVEVLRRLQETLDGRVRVSIGHSSFPVHGLSAEELHRRADAGLYEAKRVRPRGRAANIDLGWATALADAVDRRMGSDHGHSVTVAGYAARIGAALGWDENELVPLRLAATLHDIGKVAVPDRILQKPGPLTPEELAAVRCHPVVGAQIVERIEGLEAVAGWIARSHEHFDGTGYPHGLAGEDIPEAARILLVADAFDAMTSDRAYRRALSADDALAELEREAGRQFDPRCVAALAAIVGVHNAV